MNDKRKVWSLLALITATAGTVVLVAATKLYSDFSHPLMICGYVLLAAALAVRLLTWRCPKCRRLLPMRYVQGLSSCPYCGFDLR